MPDPIPTPSPEKPASLPRLLAWFLAANCLLCLFVFRGGLWGEALLAPLDILPAAASKYHFVDPASSGIPANSFIVDQVTYDLPIQTTIYNAYRRGEMPWWDAYNWAGRPLLAEAHINGTEPIRVLAYLTLPFELAYNWARVLNFVFGGLTMLLLLRHWRFSGPVCLLLALAHEFCGAFVLYFGHPWIQAQFNYYPLIWLAWDAWYQKRAWWQFPLATLAITGVFYSGNLQSHTYLALFSAAILFAYGGRSLSQWKRILPIVALPGLLGVALAAPVLLGEVELYSLSARMGAFRVERFMFGGLATFSGIYPWAFGTFRTLDLAKLVHCSNMGFHVFIGSAAMLLFLLGSSRRPERDELSPARRTGLWLIAIYLVIVTSPLESVFYSRSAGLAALGVTVLAALGVEVLRRQTAPLRRWGQYALVFVLTMVVVTHVAALVVYPRFVPRVRQMVHAANQKAYTGMNEATALRDFQVDNFANEITFKNPETVLACLGILAFGAVCLRPGLRRQGWTLPALLVLNLVPLMMFTQRFVPVQPLALWQRLTAPNSEQRRVAEILGAGNQRLMEVSRIPFDSLYPNALSHLYQARTVYGYSSLKPMSFVLMPKEELAKWMPQAADYIYESLEQGAPVGELKKNPTPGQARFQWADGGTRGLRIEKETLNGIQLAIEAGPEAELLRTDTYYPGWTAKYGADPVAIRKVNPCFSGMKIPAQARTLALTYEPTHLRKGLALAGVALPVLLLATGGLWWRGRKLTARDPLRT